MEAMCVLSSKRVRLGRDMGFFSPLLPFSFAHTRFQKSVWRRKREASYDQGPSSTFTGFLNDVLGKKMLNDVASEFGTVRVRPRTNPSTLSTTEVKEREKRKGDGERSHSGNRSSIFFRVIIC